MRRAIAAAVMGGLVLGGAVATPSFAAARGAGRASGEASPAAPAKPRADSAATTAMKTVVYEGYEFQVPASWPVYRLDEHPQTCVRYDVHAVYLGTPGTDMRCAAGLVGRTQTVSFIPGQDATAGPGTGSPGQPAPVGAGGTELQRLSAVHGTITQNAVTGELEVALGEATPGATVLGTYGTDPAVVEQVLNTLHTAPAGTASTAQSASRPSQPGETASEASRRSRLSSEAAPLAPQAAPAPAVATSTAGTPGKGTPPKPTPKPKPTYTNWRGVPAHWPVEIIQPQPPGQPGRPKPQPKPAPPVNGFDTCTAPSIATMRAWRGDYAAIGAYIGGANSACAGGNLSAGWVRAVASMGWGVLPTYVGPQAPCWGGSGVLIAPGSAAAQGTAAASDAISDARAVGLASGSPIYYDMEGYSGGTSCTDAVLEFLGSWDRQVAAAGYLTAVYSSQDSGIADLQAAAIGRTPGFTPPDAIWIALWDNDPSLSDGNLAWPLSDRSKQYEGNVNETIGGVTLNIDEDIVGGPVARLLRRILRRR